MDDFIDYYKAGKLLEKILREFIDNAPAVFRSYYSADSHFSEWCVLASVDGYRIQLTEYGGYNKDTEYTSFPLVYIDMTPEEITADIEKRVEASRQISEARKAKELADREDAERRMYEALRAKFERF